jgi:hypothetical protein
MSFNLVYLSAAQWGCIGAELICWMLDCQLHQNVWCSCVSWFSIIWGHVFDLLSPSLLILGHLLNPCYWRTWLTHQWRYISFLCLHVLFYLSFFLSVYARCLPGVFLWLVEAFLLPLFTNMSTYLDRTSSQVCWMFYFWCRYLNTLLKLQSRWWISW